MRLRLISCEVFAREIAAVVKKSPHEISINFFSKGLHEIPSSSMCERLQVAVDNAKECEAIVLAYAFCNRGIAGLRARTVPLVIPRAHDCITLLLGSRERYNEFFFENPGTYFRSPGWIERRRNPDKLRKLSQAERHGMNDSIEVLTQKYGEKKGAYLGGILGNQTANYNQLAYIETGVGPSKRFEQLSRCEADCKGWKFTKVNGDLRLLENLVNGNWNEEEFLVVSPGHEVVADYSEKIISARSTNYD